MLAARGSIPSISSFWKTFCRYCLQRSRNKKFSCWYFYVCLIHIILEEIPSNFTNFNLQWIVMRAKKNTCEEFFKHGTFFLTESENNKHTSVIIVRTETFRSHIVNTTKCFSETWYTWNWTARRKHSFFVYASKEVFYGKLAFSTAEDTPYL